MLLFGFVSVWGFFGGWWGGFGVLSFFGVVFLFFFS